MFEDEDRWINAVQSLIGCTKPNPKPLAALLRSGERIPPGARDTIAELLDPGEPEYLGVKLVLKETGGLKKSLRALETVTGHNYIGERTQYRHKDLWKRLSKRLRVD